MGWRFRKSFKIAPGVRVNFSGSGMSTSVGPRGLKLNFGKRGTRLTTSIPGTGISNSQMLTSASDSRRDAAVEEPSPSLIGSLLSLFVALVQLAFWIGLVLFGIYILI